MSADSKSAVITLAVLCTLQVRRFSADIPTPCWRPCLAGVMTSSRIQTNICLSTTSRTFSHTSWRFCVRRNCRLTAWLLTFTIQWNISTLDVCVRNVAKVLVLVERLQQLCLSAGPRPSRRLPEIEGHAEIPASIVNLCHGLSYQLVVYWIR